MDTDLDRGHEYRPNAMRSVHTPEGDSPIQTD